MGVGGGGGLRSVCSGEKVAHPSSPDLGIGHYTTITFPGLVYPSLPLDLRSGGGGGGGGGGILVWGLVPQQEENKFLILLDDMFFHAEITWVKQELSLALFACTSATYGLTFLCEQCWESVSNRMSICLKSGDSRRLAAKPQRGVLTLTACAAPWSTVLFIVLKDKKKKKKKRGGGGARNSRDKMGDMRLKRQNWGQGSQKTK